MLNSHLQLTFHSHSSWSSPPSVGRDKERTTFIGDLLRDGARGSAAGLNRNGGKIEKSQVQAQSKVVGGEWRL